MPFEVKSLYELWPSPEVAKADVMLEPQANKEHPDRGAAAKAVAERAVALAKERAFGRISDGLTGLADYQDAMNGARKDAADEADWDSELEDAIETWATGTIRQAVGIDGIGEAIGKTDFGAPGWITDLAGAWDEAVVAHLTKGKDGKALSPTQICSTVGILSADLDAMVKAPEKVKRPSAHLHDLVTALRAFADTVGATDAESLTDLLGGTGHVEETLWSDDATMRASGLTMIGALHLKDGLPEVVKHYRPQEVLAGVFSDQPVPTAKDAAKAERKGRGRKHGSASQEVGPWNDIVASIRARSALNDAELGERIGVSRSAWANYASGKTGFRPTHEQEEALAALAGDLVQAAMDIQRQIREMANGGAS